MARAKESAAKTIELVTIRIADLYLGLDIFQVQEINRQLDVTFVPHAPATVRGVVNLRGDVVTVLDLRTILSYERSEITEQSRNVIVKTQGERVGLLVDRVGDAVTIPLAEIEPPPANLDETESRFLSGIYKMKDELLGILSLDEVMA